jgi:2-polyprenyl-3-methyl-5-hydroxy-6-metoxy-1,4-benzoquinol methylase
VADKHRGWFADPEWNDQLGTWLPKRGPRRDDLAVVDRFDHEWQQFKNMPAAERARVFASYFDVVGAYALGPDVLVLDAGCGSGRWSYEIARRGARVVAMDLGLSIEVAARNTNALQVGCVQADIRDAPFRPATFDFGCSLGVLHHVPETEAALGAICRTIKPGGGVLLYLYYALETRPSWYRALFGVADVIRRALSSAPHGVTRLVATAIAGVVYWPLARSSRLFRRAGLVAIADALPLAFYADLSFRTMRNDSLDRFGTSLEKRYTAAELIRMMAAAGLREVRVSPAAPFWHATGRRSFESTGTSDS